MARRPKAVREPIQVYLTTEERSALDALAARTGISRAEVLRRGLRAFAVQQAGGHSPLLGTLIELGGDDWPADLAERHDDYLSEHYRNLHES